MQAFLFSITDFNFHLSFPCRTMREHFLMESRFFFQSILIWGFQLVLSVGRGLLISIALMFSAGICKNGLQSRRPSFAGVCPSQRPLLPVAMMAFTEGARGPSDLFCLCIVPSLSQFWLQNPLSTTSVGNLGEGPPQALCPDKPCSRAYFTGKHT